MILEIRTYRLVAGSTDEFVRVMRTESVPLVRAAGTTVVACGASLVAEDGHEEAYLIRAFDSLADRDAKEDAFYSSTAWHDGPRAAILAAIESYHTIVVEVSPDAVAALQVGD
jgi:hypothetical protein